MIETRRYIKAFDDEIIIQKIPKRFYNNKTIADALEKIFNSAVTREYGAIYENPEEGTGYSTCRLGSRIIYDIENINPLLEYIKEVILDVNNEKEIKYSKVIFYRVWANILYKNSSGGCHFHDGPHSGTAIFYFNVPENGSKLIILKHFIRGLVNETHKDISQYITVETGDLVLHDKKTFHAVSEHMSDIPRICFVFDYKLK
jgi:hypothetical protein